MDAEMKETGIVIDSKELRKLIAENPDLPIVVLAGEDSWLDEGFCWWFCSDVKAKLSEVLDCQLPFSTTIYTDHEEFADDLADYLNAPDEYILQAELKKYDSYWKKVIAIYADN